MSLEAGRENQGAGKVVPAGDLEGEVSHASSELLVTAGDPWQSLA